MHHTTRQQRPLSSGILVAAVVAFCAFVTLFVVVTMESQHHRVREGLEREIRRLEMKVRALEMERDDLRRMLNQGSVVK